MSKPLRLFLLICGLSLFAWFMYRTGWKDIQATFRALGWCSLIVLLPYAIVFSTDTLGWRFTFSPTALSNISYFVTWRVRLIGEAINSVVPSFYVGGEAAKVILLKREGVSKLIATSAAIRSKTAQSVAQSTFVALGAAVAALTLPKDQVAAKWIFALVALAGFSIVAFLFKIQKHGMVATIIKWIRKLGFKLQIVTGREEKIRELDAEIYNFYNRDRWRFRWCTLIYLGGWIFDTFEIMIVAHFLGVEVGWHHAFVIEAFIGVARGFNTLVPGALGIQEFSVVGLFALFMPEHSGLGAKYAIVRRARDAFFAVLGGGLFSFGEVTWKGMIKNT